MSATTKELVARTGRVQSWIDDPTSRLPVSCTVFVVEDSMEGPNGIEASWRFVSHALRFGAGVAVHLSKLRPQGAENGKGIVASGPVPLRSNGKAPSGNDWKEKYRLTMSNLISSWLASGKQLNDDEYNQIDKYVRKILDAQYVTDTMEEAPF